MPEVRTFETTEPQTTFPTRRHLVAGLGALSLGSFGLFAASATNAQEVLDDAVDDERRRRSLIRRRHRRRRDRRQRRRD